MLDYAFDKPDYPRINLSVYEDNVPAIKLYEKLGFRKIKIQNDETNGRSEYVMTLTKEEWESD
ncbi:MAG: GNAT family N-acetyltransferase [Desulfobacteraceae bacterium]|nr:GNAT family N-acetyltransferase [Desulfobacteraceae bacterium]